jgi:hypothetical protein
MKLAKRVFTSFTFSLPVLFLGVALFVEASKPELNNTFTVMADTGELVFSAQLFIFIVGAICILMAVASILTKFLTKN